MLRDDNNVLDFAAQFERETLADLAPIGKFPAVSFRDIVETRVSFRWLIKNWLPANSFACIYGDKGTGKSFFTMDMMIHLAMGKDWRGKKIGMPAGVAYQVGEGSSGIGKRFQAWVQENGDPGQIPLCVIPHVVNFLDADADITPFVEEIKKWENKMGCKIEVFVLDTLARAMVGGNDGDGGDMGRFIHNVEKARKELDCSALIVHHTGKDTSRGPRGHSALGAAADAMFELSRTETGTISVKIDKQKDEVSGNREFFRLKRVVIGADEDGDEIASCIITDAEKFVNDPNFQFKGPAKIAMECLVQTLLDYGTPVANVNIPKGIRAVDWHKWREKCFASGLVFSDDRQKMNNAFNAAGKILREKRAIGVYDKWVWDARRIRNDEPPAYQQIPDDRPDAMPGRSAGPELEVVGDEDSAGIMPAAG